MVYNDTWEIIGDAMEDLQDWDNFVADMETNPWAE